jgi:hypothetical protein
MNYLFSGRALECGGRSGHFRNPFNQARSYGDIIEPTRGKIRSTRLRKINVLLQPIWLLVLYSFHCATPGTVGAWITRNGHSMASLFLISVFSLLNLAVIAAAQSQIPLLSTSAAQSSPWGFNYSSAAPHYFSSVRGLLKQWPQTFFPNGHNIAAGEIPAFTKLYHGRQDDESPPSPEWLAFDM